MTLHSPAERRRPPTRGTPESHLFGRHGLWLSLGFILSIGTIGSACDDPPPPIESCCPRVTDAAYVQTLSDAGVPQFWTAASRNQCLTFHQELPGTDDLDDALETSIVVDALQKWTTAATDCGANLCMQLGDPVADGELFGYTPTGINRNVISVVRDRLLWRQMGEPANSLAVTLTTYDQFGRLLDADIALNDAGHGFSNTPNTDDGSLDFASTILHELGHALGFSHTKRDRDTNAVMWEDLKPGETRRELNATDTAGICEIYGCR